MLSVKINLAEQRLYLMKENNTVKEYLVSTGKNGAGEEWGSGKTPRGWHCIRAKIGAGSPVNAVFVGRRATGELYSSSLRESYPDRDWILTRILWLSGLEVGKNRLGNVDTMRRFIYIHGTPDDVTLGIPGSKGCIRINNHDLIELFEQVTVGTRVLIE